MGLQETSFIGRRGGPQGSYGAEGDVSKTTTGKKRGDSTMLYPTIAMSLIAGILLLIGYLRGGGEHIIGLTRAANMTIKILPLLACAFTVAGMAQVLIPHDILVKWVGVESGIRGIMVGTIAGGLAPGGPYISLPIAAGLLRAGANVGTMVAFLTGWSLWAVGRLPMEVGILGWKFTLIRLACTFFFPPIAGILANRFFSALL
jgi:uncharacterized membrane protein YraQ (UPF0718 family)